MDEQGHRGGRRLVYHADALHWLKQPYDLAQCSFVTSLPDISELAPLSLEAWMSWFIDAAALVLSRCSEQGVVIFYQTDLKREGCWVDKSYLCQKAAEAAGHSLLWHKIVCRVPPGRVSFGRPGFSHLLCFSRGVRAEVATSTADVAPLAGAVTWTRGMGVDACLLACRFILTHTSTRTIVDPFCGHGTVLAVANHLGLDAIGVELGAKRARRARGLEISGRAIVKKERGPDHAGKDISDD